MIERFFYKTLSEELTKRGFFVATEHAPEKCVGICGINGTEKRVKYVKYLQKNYRLAAIKNIIFDIGNYSSDGECHCTRGWSLQALINMLPDVIWTENKLGKWFYSCNIQKDQVDYGCITEGGSWSVMISSPQGELVDAIVSMLLCLSEHKLYDFSNYGKDETKTAD